MSMAGPGYAGTDNAGYRYPGEMDSGLRALVLLCIRVHGTRRSMAGLSGYPVPRSMVGYAYGYQWRVSAMRGTRYPCQWQTMIVAGWCAAGTGLVGRVFRGLGALPTGWLACAATRGFFIVASRE